MKALSMIILTSFFTVSAWAGTAEVTWHEPKNYRDIRASNEIESRFQARVFSEFEKHFNLLAEKLPEQHTLKITVTDVDLAGEVLPQSYHAYHGGFQALRVVKSMDFPRMEFSYVVENERGEITASGEERLRGRDLPGQGRTSRRASSQHELLDYERAMLDRWFKFRFEPELK